MKIESKLHHAILLENIEDSKNFVSDILNKKFSFETKNNPDFIFFDVESFGIDDARGFEKWAIGKPFTGEIKSALITTESITTEAQNALLKIFEEPPLGTFIFINIANRGNLLGTFLSRLAKLDEDTLRNLSNEKSESTKKDKEIINFLNGSIKDRFSLARSLSKSDNKSEMKNLISSMEQIAFEQSKIKENMMDIGKAQNLKKILNAKIFSSAKGSSPKMLLDWLSSVL